MPELPEVESLKRSLAPLVQGETCMELTLHREGLREAFDQEALHNYFVGSPVERLSRRSKYLILHTQKGCLVIHLGMSGYLIEKPSAEPEIKHTHVVFAFSQPHGSKRYIHFVDVRRFGRMFACRASELSTHRFLSGLGPEPLETKDLAARLYRAAKGRRVPIKTFLMDNAVVVGVGNIYACESLFRSAINPVRLASSLSLKEFENLSLQVQKTLTEAIAAGGTTLRDFRTTQGEPGYFSVRLDVYGRAHQPCHTCGQPIEVIKQSGRSTFYCPVCQP